MKRFKKILKWTGIVLGGLVAILLIANAIFVWTTDTRLERQLAAIRAAGEPLSLAELARPPIPPEKNAATYLRRAEADVAAIVKEMASLNGVFHIPGRLMSPDDQKKVKAVLDAYPNAVPLLERAAACPDYDLQLDYTVSAQEFTTELMGPVNELRSPSRVLRARAMLLAAEGNRDEVVRTALMILRLARHLDRNPTMICYLVAIAVRFTAMDTVNVALQAGPVSKQVRVALENELTVQERMDGYDGMIKSERVFGLDSCKAFPLRRFWLVSRGFWNRHESDYLDALDAFTAAAHDPRPYRDTIQTIRRIPETHGVLVRLLFPAVQATHDAVTRTRATIRCLRVLNALQTHVPAESDETPKLSELGLPVETTTDPYTGEPLHVKKLPQGWVVYSVGKNLKDDGGKMDDQLSDVGFGPPPAEKPAEK